MYTKTVKLKLYPSPEQSMHMLNTLKAYNAACNFSVGYAIRNGLDSVHTLTRATYRDIREHFKLGAQMSQSVSRTAMNGLRASRSIHNKKWVHCQFNKLEYDLVYNVGYSFTSDEISIGSLKGRLIMPYEHKYTELLHCGGKLGTGRVIMRNGEWYILIPVTIDKFTPDISDPIFVGIDLGLNFIATLYDSNGVSRFYKGKQLKQLHRIKKAFRRKLQAKETQSAKALLRRYGHKEANFRSNINHCITKEIVNMYPPGTVFVLEDLGRAVLDMIDKTWAKRIHYDISSWSYADFRIKLTYKANVKGSTVILVPPTYTSQTCPICGNIDKHNRNRKKHEFCCTECGYRTNDDRAAAFNILNRGIHIFNAGQNLQA